MADGKISGLVQDIIDRVKEISEISGYRCAVRKPFFSLARRLLILTPFLEEIRDLNPRVSPNLFYGFTSLLKNLELTKKLLRQGSKGSKIYLVLDRKQVIREYEALIARLEEDLTRIHLEKLEISDEVKEQAGLVLVQFKRARRKIDAPDRELYEDLWFLYDKGTDGVTDPYVLRELVVTLELTEATDLAQESLALNEMVSTWGGDRGLSIEKMSRVLKIITDFVQGENHSSDSYDLGQSSLARICSRQGTIEMDHENEVPNEFMCPISLQLMQDPVTISTGQTFERSSIETWLQAGKGTCPKTRQILTNPSIMVPNYQLRSLIAQWCETNGIESPTRVSRTTASSCTPTERIMIYNHIQELKSSDPHHQHTGAGEICLLAKRNAQNRVAIGEAGAIPLLTKLLQATDPKTQEYAVTTLLNLSIYHENKKRIVFAGAILGIIHVMKEGTLEARENAAATLFSLSVTDEIRMIIGNCGGIAPLVWMLREGPKRGKNDAATALFNLCLHPCNRARAVRDGVVPELLVLLKEPQGNMKDEALALLALIASHDEGREAIGEADPVVHLVNIIWNGSQTNQGHATSVLLQLCSADQKYLVEAKVLGVEPFLVYLQQYGSDQGKRKANQLLEMITQHTQQRNESGLGPRPSSGPNPGPILGPFGTQYF